MSCGKTLPGRLDRLPAQAARLLWPDLAGAQEIDLWVQAWDNEASAAEARRLNETEHGHAGACYGPVLTEAGWVTCIDLRPYIAKLRAQRSNRTCGRP